MKGRWVARCSVYGGFRGDFWAKARRDLRVAALPQELLDDKGKYPAERDQSVAVHCVIYFYSINVLHVASAHLEVVDGPDSEGDRGQDSSEGEKENRSITT